MAVRSILRIGDPRLRQVAEPVDAYDTPDLHELIEDMFDTMAAADGAGLAATQIGLIKQVMNLCVESTPRYPGVSPVPTNVLTHPVSPGPSAEIAGFWEGCLSVPGMRGYVERPARIRYSGYDQFGNHNECDAAGFHAIVFQHEYDHLQGVLYPDHIVEHDKFGFTEELAAAGEI